MYVKFVCGTFVWDYCMLSLCVCVKLLYVRLLYVKFVCVCVKLLYVRLLYVKFVCVRDYCMLSLCVWNYCMLSLCVKFLYVRLFVC